MYEFLMWFAHTLWQYTLIITIHAQKACQLIAIVGISCVENK